MEKENFSRYTRTELFYYLMDNLIIPPNANFKNWEYYKEHMMELAEDFQNRCYEKINIEKH